jgi:predicted kinase
MTTLTITVGLPGSGKSFWADAQCAANPNIVRVERDQIRFELTGSRRNFEREGYVSQVSESRIQEALLNGRDVICSDTNVKLSYRNTFRKLAEACGAEFEEVWFDTDIDVCIARDALRADPVGEEIIRKFAQVMASGMPSCRK